MATLEELRKARLEEELRLLDELAAPMSEEDRAIFEEAVRGG